MNAASAWLDPITVCNVAGEETIPYGEEILKIDVILPVCNNADEFTGPLLNMVAQNTHLPNKVIVIDNGSTDTTREVVRAMQDDIPIDRHYFPENMGVNFSWNYGMKCSNADAFCILNNDLVIPEFFFEQLNLSLEEYKHRAGIVVPRTAKSIDEVVSATTPARVRLSDMGNGVEGWAFTIQRKVAEQAGEIPKSLRTFYGDNYLFESSIKSGYLNLKMDLVPVFHYVSRTLYATGRHEDCPTDKDAWEETKIRAEGMTWTEVPMHVDMSPYADWYMEWVKKSVTKDRPARVVEIGTRYGCSARILAAALRHYAPDYQLILIDVQRTYEANEIVDGKTIRFWNGRGQDFADQFEDESINLLHIDTDPHDGFQEGQLFDLYKYKIAPGGAIVFHDATDAYGVKKMLETYALKTDGWKIFYCDPAETFPQAAPATLKKLY